MIDNLLLPGILKRLLPSGRIDGDEYHGAWFAGGVWHDLKVDLASGLWSVTPDGVEGRGLVALACLVWRVGREEAAARLLGQQKES
jgi:hypothetical protein